MFADDNSLYKPVVSFNKTNIRLQNSLNDAELWYKNNCLPVNTIKTLCLVSASTRKLRELRESNTLLNLQFDDETLSQVDKCIYHGLSLDNDLK